MFKDLSNDPNLFLNEVGMNYFFVLGVLWIFPKHLNKHPSNFRTPFKFWTLSESFFFIIILFISEKLVAASEISCGFFCAFAGDYFENVS